MGAAEEVMSAFQQGFLEGAICALKVLDANGESEGPCYQEIVVSCNIRDTTLAVEGLPLRVSSGGSNGK